MGLMKGVRSKRSGKTPYCSSMLMSTRILLSDVAYDIKPPPLRTVALSVIMDDVLQMAIDSSISFVCTAELVVS